MSAESLCLVADRSLLFVLFVCSRDLFTLATLCHSDMVEGNTLVVLTKYLDLPPHDTVSNAFVAGAFLSKVLLVSLEWVFGQDVLWKTQTFAPGIWQWL